jgi:hypothetical protein
MGRFVDRSKNRPDDDEPTVLVEDENFNDYKEGMDEFDRIEELDFDKD